MILVNCVVGARTDPDLHERLHELEHHNAVETVMIATTDLDRRRLLVRTRVGEEVAIALPREQKLFDGAVLVLEKDRAIVVKAGVQRWLRLSPQSADAALELGYNAGNLHWRVRFDGSDLLVALDGPVHFYTARVESLIKDGRISMSEIVA